jgi:hypothetical protein
MLKGGRGLSPRDYPQSIRRNGKASPRNKSDW